MSNKIIIAVTGKQGSGKSTICNYLAKEMNADVLNLDIYSHKALQNENVINILKERYNNQIFTNGKIDRKKLGKIVFNNKEELNFINHLVYKYMIILIEQDLKKCKNIVILDYALLPNTKFWNISNFKILVTADNNVRMQRLIKRDNVQLSYLQSREQASISYNTNVDLVIENNNILNLEELSKNISKKIYQNVSLKNCK